MKQTGKINYKGEVIYLMHDFKYNNILFEFRGRYYSTLVGAKRAVTLSK